MRDRAGLSSMDLPEGTVFTLWVMGGEERELKIGSAPTPSTVVRALAVWCAPGGVLQCFD